MPQLQSVYQVVMATRGDLHQTNEAQVRPIRVVLHRVIVHGGGSWHSFERWKESQEFLLSLSPLKFPHKLS